jgi:hypothetical protein
MNLRAIMSGTMVGIFMVIGASAAEAKSHHGGGASAFAPGQSTANVPPGQQSFSTGPGSTGASALAPGHHKRHKKHHH